MAHHRVFNIIPPSKLIQSIHKSVEYLTFQEIMAYSSAKPKAYVSNRNYYGIII
jgi:hypothetical protein